jgi:predicted DNA-binding ribbon-helix-helix protein
MGINWEQMCPAGVVICMKSSVIKRSVMFSGHKTSISLEDAFWNALKDIAASRQTPVRDLIASIDAAREDGSLSSGCGSLCSITLSKSVVGRCKIRLLQHPNPKRHDVMAGGL